MSRWSGATAQEIEEYRRSLPPQKRVRAAGAKCGAATKERTSKCALSAGARTDHPGYGQCNLHGGSTPNGKRHAALLRVREVVNEQRDAQTFFGQRIDVTPEQVMMIELQRSHGIVVWIEEQLRMFGWQVGLDSEIGDVERLLNAAALADLPEVHSEWDAPAYEEDGITGLPTLVAIHTTEHAVGFTDTELAAWMKVYREERVHLSKHAKTCIDAGIEERLMQSIEAKQQIMVTVLVAAMKHLGRKATPAQLREALAVGVAEARSNLNAVAVTS